MKSVAHKEDANERPDPYLFIFQELELFRSVRKILNVDPIWIQGTEVGSSKKW